MIDYVASIIVGVLSSLLASGLFLIFISRIKPKVDVSKAIARRRNADGSTAYIIKVINRRHRSVINVNARVHLITPKVVPGGIVSVTREIKLIGSNPLEITGFNRNDKEASFAHRFMIYENLDDLWEDDERSYLRFRMFASDSLSNFGKVISQDYHTKRNTIKDGDFEKGNSFTIV